MSTHTILGFIVIDVQYKALLWTRVELTQVSKNLLLRNWNHFQSFVTRSLVNLLCNSKQWRELEHIDNLSTSWARLRYLDNATSANIKHSLIDKYLKERMEWDLLVVLHVYLKVLVLLVFLLVDVEMVVPLNIYDICTLLQHTYHLPVMYKHEHPATENMQLLWILGYCSV